MLRYNRDILLNLLLNHCLTSLHSIIAVYDNTNRS
jgi:hypothetical protein